MRIPNRLLSTAILVVAMSSCRQVAQRPATWSELRPGVTQSALAPDEEAQLRGRLWFAAGNAVEPIADAEEAAQKLWSVLSPEERAGLLRFSQQDRAGELLTKIRLTNEGYRIQHGSYGPSLEALGYAEAESYLHLIFGDLPYEFDYTGGETTWSVSATPTASELPHLFTDQAGPVRVALDGPATAETPTFLWFPPSYVWQMEKGKFYPAKSVPSEWKDGSFEAAITDIEFTE